MKFYFGTLAILLIATAFLVIHTSKSQVFAEQTHVRLQVERENSMRENNQTFTAKFLIYTNGTQRILTGKKYILQWPDAFLTNTEPTHVRVARQGVTWNEFFQSIGVQMNSSCLVLSELQQFCENHKSNLKFYLNGKKDPDVLNKEIHDGDLLLVSYGAENKVELDKQIKSVRELK